MSDSKHKDTPNAFQGLMDDIRGDRNNAAVQDGRNATAELAKSRSSAPAGFEVQDQGAWSRALQDAQRWVGGGDPLLQQLDGLDNVLQQTIAAKAGSVGLAHRGATVSQRNQGNQPAPKSINESRAGGQLHFEDGSSLPDTPENRKLAKDEGLEFRVQ